jgi:regulator of sigma E protease
MNTILLFIVVLGPLIFFHELGHFLVARFFGVGVEKFSFGFGPRIIGKKIGRTDYRISLIPLGGFVKMVGDEPNSELPPEDISLSFTNKHVAKRSLIVFAGPFFNILLSLAIFWCILYFHGIASIQPVVRNIDPDSPAAQTSLKIGDRIEAVDQTPVASWRDINTVFDASIGEPIILHIIHRGETRQVELVPQKAVYTDVFGDDISYFDFGISGVAEPLAIVGEVMEDMPASEAGLQKWDRIISIDGQQ